MNKYRNKRVNDPNYGKFDSQREHARWYKLKDLEKGGTIHSLERQPSFAIKLNNILICKYVADFIYFENGKRIVEDSKGFETREFKLKKKLMKALYNIEVRIT